MVSRITHWRRVIPPRRRREVGAAAAPAGAMGASTKASAACDADEAEAWQRDGRHAACPGRRAGRHPKARRPRPLPRSRSSEGCDVAVLAGAAATPPAPRICAAPRPRPGRQVRPKRPPPPARPTLGEASELEHRADVFPVHDGRELLQVGSEVVDGVRQDDADARARRVDVRPGIGEEQDQFDLGQRVALALEEAQQLHGHVEGDPLQVGAHTLEAPSAAVKGQPFIQLRPIDAADRRGHQHPHALGLSRIRGTMTSVPGTVWFRTSTCSSPRLLRQPLGDGLLGLHLAVPAQAELERAAQPVLQADGPALVAKRGTLDDDHGRSFSASTADDGCSVIIRRTLPATSRVASPPYNRGWENGMLRRLGWIGWILGAALLLGATPRPQASRRPWSWCSRPGAR